MIVVSASQLDRYVFPFSLGWLLVLTDAGQVARAVHRFLVQIHVLKIFSKGDIGTNIPVNPEPLSSKLTNQKTRERRLNTRLMFSV